MVVDLSNVLRLISNLGLSIITTYSDLFNLFALTTVDIPGFGEITLTQFMFGTGLTVFITVTIAKWLIGVIT